MGRIINAVNRHRARAGIALVIAIGLVLALTTLAAPAKKVTNGQLVFRTSLPNQTVNFKCTGGQQKTVRTYNLGQGHWYAGPFNVTSAKAGDKRDCSIQVVIPAGYELIPGNKAQLTRTVKAGDRSIVNWTFTANEAPPTDAPEPEPTDTPTDAPETPIPTPVEEDKPNQVIIVPAEPAEPVQSLPDTGDPISDPPPADPAQDLTIPPADEPVPEEDSPAPVSEDSAEEAPLDEDVGNLGGFSADSTSQPESTPGSSDASLRGGGDGTELAAGLPGISPTPSADVAAERAAIPAWQQWLLVIVILGGVGALAYFGLKYYRENQV